MEGALERPAALVVGLGGDEVQRFAHPLVAVAQAREDEQNLEHVTAPAP